MCTSASTRALAGTCHTRVEVAQGMKKCDMYEKREDHLLNSGGRTLASASHSWKFTSDFVPSYEVREMAAKANMKMDGLKKEKIEKKFYWKTFKNCAVFNLRQRYNSSSLSLEAAIIVDIEDEWTAVMLMQRV